MCFIYAKIVFILFCITNVRSQRRIVGGKVVSENKPYMVYIVNDMSEKYGAANAEHGLEDKAWICGGVIITHRIVLSSYYCLRVGLYYQIVSGYNKYVPNFYDDLCYQKMGKRVVQKIYFNRIDNTTKDNSGWIYQDIGAAVTETPFDFFDKSYLKYCTYMPETIPISYRPEYIAPGATLLVLGWGSNKYYRSDRYSHLNFNQEYLMGTTVKVLNESECVKYYNKWAPGEDVMKYTMCSSQPGDLDMYGNIYHSQTSSIGNRQGPCQNDHGGPVVTWIGGREYLVGITTAFLLNEKRECVGPYLYTHMIHFKHLVECIMHNTRRSDIGCSDVVWHNESDFRGGLSIR